MKKLIFLLFCINIVCFSYGQKHTIIWHGYTDKSGNLQDITVTDLNNDFLKSIQECDKKNQYFKFVPSYSSKNVSNSIYTLEGIIAIEDNNNGKRIVTRLYEKLNKETGTPCSDVVSPNHFKEKAEEHARKKYANLVEILIPKTEDTQPETKENEPQRQDTPGTVNNTFDFLPFGIHQFVNKQTGKGILFAGVQGVLLGTGIGYCLSAKSNLRKHKDLKYEDWERDRFYDKYESQKNTLKWLFIGTTIMIGWNYCDNFNWFRKNKIKTGFISTLDWQGKPQMAMTLEIGF